MIKDRRDWLYVMYVTYPIHISLTFRTKVSNYSLDFFLLQKSDYCENFKLKLCTCAQSQGSATFVKQPPVATRFNNSKCHRTVNHQGRWWTNRIIILKKLYENCYIFYNISLEYVLHRPIQ